MSGSTRPSSKPEMRGSITMLVLGDEGVGKSSLISTFVSHHFSEVVPGIMTRVRLPPDPDSNCITTIVDSQGGDAALISAVAAMSLSTGDSSNSLSSLLQQANADVRSSPNVATGIEHVDSIILVYDLDRIETFYRLENHWLPLIERCYNGEMPVIIAGNKMDLFRPSNTAGMTDEQALARSRQQIVSLMQRFRFVRQCIKCSAKNLLRVDEVFVKAQQAVLYPFTPLYDLLTGRLTDNCKRAFTRIFRMYDLDNDGLLSNAELDAFQNQTFHVPLVEKDLAGWKKVVHRNNPTDEPVVRDGKFTVAGFLAIFDVFISQNRLDVPWKVLRKFGYDDDLVLHVPPSISAQTDDAHWKLSKSARQFLARMFYQFDSNHDGILSADDVAAIFSIIPEPSLPPWHPVRAPKVFEGCFSLPKVPPPSSGSGSSREGSDASSGEQQQPMALSQSLSTSGITIISASSLPTVDMSSSLTHPVSQPMTFLEWMGQWHMISAISPSTARAELFRLGHVEDSRRRDSKKRRRKNSGVDYSSVVLPSQEIRVLVLGSRGSGKTALLNCLCSDADTSPTETSSTTKPVTTSTCIRMKKQPIVKGVKVDEDGQEFAVHLVFTEVPEAQGNEASKQMAELKHVIGSPTGKNRFCDLVAFTFDSTKEESLAYAKEMEAELLSDDVARVFVATKGDVVDDTVLIAAKEHCRELDLEAPLLTSATDSMLGSSNDPAAAKARANVLEQLANCVLEENGVDQLRSKPHAEKKRKEAAKRRKMIWLGGLVGVSVAVAVGVGVLWGGVGKGERKGRAFGWLRHILGGGIVGMSSTSTTAQS